MLLRRFQQQGQDGSFHRIDVSEEERRRLEALGYTSASERD